MAYVDGRSVNNNLLALVELRRAEFDGYRKVGGDRESINSTYVG